MKIEIAFGILADGSISRKTMNYVRIVLYEL
jgi:hypothetical protein